MDRLCKDFGGEREGANCFEHGKYSGFLFLSKIDLVDAGGHCWVFQKIMFSPPSLFQYAMGFVWLVTVQSQFYKHLTVTDSHQIETRIVSWSYNIKLLAVLLCILMLMKSRHYTTR